MLLIVGTQVAPRAAASLSSWSGCVGAGWTKLLIPRAGWAQGRVCSLIRANPAGAWEE